MAGGVSVAASHTKKLVKFTLSIFRPRFNSSKCKTAAKMAVARIKLLRNKREVVVKQMRRDIALLLQSGQDATARIRVEHVIREQNVLAANEFIELFCELVVARLSIISKRRECPSDLKEGIASLIFASPRCSEIPELVAIRRIFEKKFGRDFVSAAVDLRPNCGVNRMLIDKLSVRTPPGELKLKVMKEIAKEYQIQWDTSESEKELLKAPEELIEGPRTFVSATSLPFKPTSVSVAPNKPSARSPFEGETGNMQFKDTASAAGAAAESAKKAIAAAQAAAHLANRDFNPLQTSGLDHSSINHGFSTFSGNLTDLSMLNDPQVNHQTMYNESQMDLSNGSHHLSNGNTRSTRMGGEHIYRRHSYNETRPVNLEGENISRRQSYNAFSPHLDIKFDESDCDEEIEMERLPAGVCRPPPDRPPPPIPSSHVKTDSPAHQVHPKLPDYDALAARFEALKHRKS